MKLHGLRSLLVATLAGGVSADETFLAPGQTAIPPGSSVRIDLSVSAVFPLMESAVPPARVARAAVRLADLSEKPVPVEGTKSLRLTYTSLKDKEGVATVFASLRPKTQTLDPRLVRDYADAIGRPELFTAWNSRPEPRLFREESTKHAKAFFRVGKNDESWQIPVGQALELVPLTDPTRGVADEPFIVQVLQAGQPVPDLSIVAIFDSKTPRTIGRTDSEGKATFRLAKPGRWLFSATQMRISKKANLDYESDVSTLLVMIRPLSMAGVPPAK